MNTKYFAVLFFIASAAAVELIDPFHKARTRCMKQAGLSEEKLASSKNHLQILGKYLVCWVHEVGIPCDAQGRLDPATFVKKTKVVLSDALAGLIVDVCNEQVVESGLTEAGAQAVCFVRCLKKAIPDRLFDATGLLKRPIYLRLEQL